MSVLALVAFERNSQQADPNCNDEGENDCRQSPPCKLHELSVDVGFAHRESSYFDENWNVATFAVWQHSAAFYGSSCRAGQEITDAKWLDGFLLRAVAQ